MQADPAGLADLRRLGVPLVPAVAVGDRAVHGWNPPAYAALLGVAYRAPTRLAPAELAARLDRILDNAERLTAQLEPGQLDSVPAERKRSVRDLAYHVFRLALAFIDGADRGQFPEAWLQETAPPDLVTGGDIARYGALVRARLSGWFQGAGPAEYERVIDVYYGPQSVHELLERTTWHAAQHLRQLHVLIERLGVRAPAPLPVDAFAGLPLPEAIW